MPRDVDIQPGSTFHLPAAQDKNIQNLLKIFGKKEATQALTEMAKVDKSTWGDIRSTVSDLKQISALGGRSNIIAGFKATVDLQIESLFSSFTNEVDQLIADALSPIQELINDIVNDLSQFISDNAVGAGVGGIVGGVAALFLPGGPLLVALGALVGATIEAWWQNTLDNLPTDTPGGEGYWRMTRTGWVWVPTGPLPPTELEGGTAPPPSDFTFPYF